MMVGHMITRADPILDYHTPSTPSGDPSQLSQSRRFISVDALRGFDMFWIVGGDHLIRSLPKVHDSPLTRTLAAQMEHNDWAGFHFYDLIFPLFVWIVGVSIPFSIPKMIERDGRAAAIRRIVVRSVLLFALGVFYMGGLSNGFKNVYFAGVLHRIAVAYFFAAMLFCFFRPRALAILVPVFLLGYWALLTFVPVPGIGPASYAHAKNLAYYVDQRWMPGQHFEGTILSTPAAVANCLLGIFAGLLLKDVRRTERRKVLTLLGAGAASLGLGILWSFQFPIIKLLWTSSYVLVSCGIAAMLLGVFHLVIEVWRLRTWAMPFVWIGMNAITIYIASALLNFRKIADRFVGGDVAHAMGSSAELVRSAVALLLAFWLAYFLYRRKVFLRL
jgi:predicted acyltransferase